LAATEVVDMAARRTVDESVSPIEYRASLRLLVYPLAVGTTWAAALDAVQKQAEFWRRQSPRFTAARHETLDARVLVVRSRRRDRSS
jgi:hypothetical protein